MGLGRIITPRTARRKRRGGGGYFKKCKKGCLPAGAQFSKDGVHLWLIQSDHTNRGGVHSSTDQTFYHKRHKVSFLLIGETTTGITSLLSIRYFIKTESRQNILKHKTSTNEITSLLSVRYLIKTKSWQNIPKHKAANSKTNW